jgi:hypothetical protein
LETALCTNSKHFRKNPGKKIITSIFRSRQEMVFVKLISQLNLLLIKEALFFVDKNLLSY